MKITPIKASKFQSFLEELGYETRSYIGRGMYAKDSLSIRISSPPLSVVQKIAYQWGDDVDSFVLPPVYADSLGLDHIIYWPELPYTEYNFDSEND